MVNYFEVLFETLKFSLKGKYSLLVLLFAFLYVALSEYALNYRLVLSTIFGSYPLSYKFSLLLSLLPGVYTAMSTLDFYLILLTAILVGTNFMLLIRTIQNLKSAGNVGFLVGGSSILGIATIGCTTCGLTLLSVLGLSAAFSLIPFGMYFYFFSIAALLFSIFYMLKKLAAVCKLPTANR